MHSPIAQRRVPMVVGSNIRKPQACVVVLLRSGSCCLVYSTASLCGAMQKEHARLQQRTSRMKVPLVDVLAARRMKDGSARPRGAMAPRKDVWPPASYR